MSASPKPIDPALVRELAEILRDADLGEIEIERDDLRIRVSRMSSLPAPAMAPANMAAAMPMQAAPAVFAAPAAPAPTSPQPAPPATSDHPGTVRSPMVGTVYLSADPNSPTYAPVGKAVAVGDTLMLIEAMKTYNPVTATRAGVVKSVLVSNEQPVEYDQPLIVIE